MRSAVHEARWVFVAWACALDLACADHSTLRLGSDPREEPVPGAIEDGVVSLRPLRSGSVSIPAQSEIEFADHFTLEAWLFPHSARGGTLFCKVGGGELKRIALDALYVEVELVMATAPEAVTLRSEVALSALEWHHIALSYERGELTLFVDGQPGARHQRMDPVVDGIETARWGSCPEDGSGPADASVSDLRFSRTGRYIDAFTPNGSVSPDDATSALFHFREGVAGPAQDSGPHRVTATIDGPVQWPLLPARP